MLRLKDHSLLIQKAFVGGVWTDATGGATVTVDNPATGTLIGSVPDCSAEDTERAIAAAAEAFKSWRLTTAAERARLLERWHDLLLDNADDLALIMTSEQGKPLAEARGEILYGASFIKWFAE